MFKLANHLMFETEQEKDTARVLLVELGYAKLIWKETKVAFSFENRKTLEIIEEVLKEKEAHSKEIIEMARLLSSLSDKESDLIMRLLLKR